MQGDDILTSLRALGFDNYEEVMKVYLAKFREVSPRSRFIGPISLIICSNNYSASRRWRTSLSRPMDRARRSGR